MHYDFAMRLTNHQSAVIVEILRQHFGAGSRVRLFGSRTDDQARGGDIDLFLEPEIQEPDALVEAKLQALVDLHKALGEQKIDIVIARKDAPELPIHQIARRTGISI